MAVLPCIAEADRPTTSRLFYNEPQQSEAPSLTAILAVLRVVKN
jgi:hypothetical protein